MQRRTSSGLEVRAAQSQEWRELSRGTGTSTRGGEALGGERCGAGDCCGEKVALAPCAWRRPPPTALPPPAGAPAATTAAKAAAMETGLHPPTAAMVGLSEAEAPGPVLGSARAAPSARCGEGPFLAQVEEGDAGAAVLVGRLTGIAITPSGFAFGLRRACIRALTSSMPRFGGAVARVTAPIGKTLEPFKLTRGGSSVMGETMASLSVRPRLLTEWGAKPCNAIRSGTCGGASADFEVGPKLRRWPSIAEVRATSSN